MIRRGRAGVRRSRGRRPSPVARRRRLAALAPPRASVTPAVAFDVPPPLRFPPFSIIFLFAQNFSSAFSRRPPLAFSPSPLVFPAPRPSPPPLERRRPLPTGAPPPPSSRLARVGRLEPTLRPVSFLTLHRLPRPTARPGRTAAGAARPPRRRALRRARTALFPAGRRLSRRPLFGARRCTGGNAAALRRAHRQSRPPQRCARALARARVAPLRWRSSLSWSRNDFECRLVLPVRASPPLLFPRPVPLFLCAPVRTHFPAHRFPAPPARRALFRSSSSLPFPPLPGRATDPLPRLRRPVASSPLFRRSPSALDAPARRATFPATSPCPLALGARRFPRSAPAAWPPPRDPLPIPAPLNRSDALLPSFLFLPSSDTRLSADSPLTLR